MFKTSFSASRRCNKFAILNQLNKEKKAEKERIRTNTTTGKTIEALTRNATIEEKQQKKKQKAVIDEFFKEVQRLLDASVLSYESKAQSQNDAVEVEPLSMILKVGTTSAYEYDLRTDESNTVLSVRIRYTGDIEDFSKQSKKAITLALATLGGMCGDAAAIVVCLYCESEIDTRLQVYRSRLFNK